MSAEIRGSILREASIKTRKQLSIEENVILDDFYATYDRLVEASSAEILTEEDIEIFEMYAHRLVAGSELIKEKYKILFEFNKQSCLSEFN